MICVFLVLVKGKNPKSNPATGFQNFFYIYKKVFFLLKSKKVFKRWIGWILDYFVVMSY